MIYTYLIVSIILLVIANIIKVVRLGLFYQEYENPRLDVFSRALAINNILNFFVPFRLGFIYRIWHTGQKSKNGTSFSLATIIVEIIIDFICVSIIYIIFILIGVNSKASIIFYFACIGIIIIIALVLEILKKIVKRFIYNFARLFNESIELKILKSTWFTIVSFKNILNKVNKIKLISYSILLWSLNVLSCFCLSRSITNFETMKDIFNMFFSNSGIKSSILSNIINLDKNIIIFIVLYTIISNVILALVSFVLKNVGKVKNKYKELLPHVNLSDRLNFLSMYFENDDRSMYIKKYLDLNSDVAIIEDFSAGSNATTMLCSKDGKTY